MLPWVLLALALTALALIAARRTFLSFGAQSPADYADAGPVFDPRQHLSGPMVSEGVIFGPTGRIAGRFTARMSGRWNNDGGVLDEVFEFASGSTMRRAWTLRDLGGQRMEATAPDIVGKAEVERTGAAMRMRYRLRLDDDAGGHVLTVTDWLYLAPDGAVLNRSEMRKFGIKLAELVATIRPMEEGRP